MSYDVQFSKGSLSVDLHSDSVSEEYKNQLVVLNLAQSSTNQASGKKDTKVLDLLRITHQFVIRAYIAKNSTKSAKQQKDDLISISNGGGINGGTVSFTYDGDTYSGYLEKVIAVKESSDHPAIESTQEAKYKLTITFVVGTSV